MLSRARDWVELLNINPEHVNILCKKLSDRTSSTPEEQRRANGGCSRRVCRQRPRRAIVLFVTSDGTIARMVLWVIDLYLPVVQLRAVVGE